MRLANVYMGFRGMQWSHTVLETHPHLRNTQSLHVSGALHVAPGLPLGHGSGRGLESSSELRLNWHFLS